MLVKLRADIKDIELSCFIVQWDASKIQEEFDAAIQHIIERADGQFKVDISLEIASWIVGEVMTHLAVRLDTSAGFLGGSSSFSGAIGLAAGIVGDYLISWVWADPKGNLIKELNQKLDTIHQMVIKNLRLRPKLQAFSRKHSQAREKALLHLLSKNRY